MKYQVTRKTKEGTIFNTCVVSDEALLLELTETFKLTEYEVIAVIKIGR